MQITDKKYFDLYCQQIGHRIKSLINKFDFSDNTIDLGYSNQAAAVFSSNIEGNSIDLNSYMNYQLSKEKFKTTKEIEEIENLVKTYNFGQSNSLTETNFLEGHKICSETLLIKSKRGKYRTKKVAVFGPRGLIYLAIEPEFVPETMIFFQDIESLLKQHTSVAEAFYFASLVHLKFAHIHPFMDGNGRAARLLEKWFQSEKLGPQFLKIPSEKYYWDHRDEYYANINQGVNYYELNYDLCLPFLAMLPNCLRIK